MALAKLHDETIEISGRFGGTILKRDEHNSYGQSTTKEFKSPEALHTEHEILWIKLYETMQRDFMSPEFIEEWANYAYNHPLTTNTGEEKYINGFHWFFKINLVRMYNNLEPLEHPPDR